MSDRPWSKFFWTDWESDERLRQCSLAAQGLWMRMLCICAKGEPTGYLAVAGQPLDASGVARSAGITMAEAETLMAELEAWGVFSRDRKGRIYSRRMVKDEQKQQTARKHGTEGGNPKLKDGYNKPGFIYLMGARADGKYKVGISTNPKNRLKKVRSQYPNDDIRLIEAWHVPDMGSYERSLHEFLTGSPGGSRSGEWFSGDRISSEKIGNFLRSLKGQEKGSTRTQRPEARGQSIYSPPPVTGAAEAGAGGGEGEGNRLDEMCKRVQQVINSPVPMNGVAPAVQRWLGWGADFERDVMPTIEGVMAQRNGKPPGAINYFDKSIKRALDERTRAAPSMSSEPANIHDPDAIDPNTDAETKRRRWRYRVQHFADGGVWPHEVYGPKPGDPQCRAPDDVLHEFGFERRRTANA